MAASSHAAKRLILTLYFLRKSLTQIKCVALFRFLASCRSSPARWQRRPAPATCFYGLMPIADEKGTRSQRRNWENDVAICRLLYQCRARTMIAVRAQGLHVQTAVHPASADERLRWRKPKSVRVGHRLAGDLAVADIEAVAQMDVVPQSLPPTLVAKLQRKGQGGVVERKSRRACHRSRHVGDAIMHHAIDHKGRIGMGRRPRRFGTSALIDGDVDEHGALLHRLQHCASNEFGRGSPRHEHRADYEIGFSDEVSDRSARREDIGRASCRE